MNYANTTRGMSCNSHMMSDCRMNANQRMTSDGNCSSDNNLRSSTCNSRSMNSYSCPSQASLCKAENGKKSMNNADFLPPSMAYVPWQEWGEIYPKEKGFHAGTIFCNLDKPFLGGKM